MIESKTVDIQQQAVSRAIRLLEAAGARFAIEFRGETSGNAELQAKKRSKPIRDLAGTYGYLDMVSRLEAGGSIKITANDGDAETLRAAVCNAMTKKFGSGNYISHVRGNVVEALAA